MNLLDADIPQIELLLKKYLIPFFLKVIGAFVLWFVADLFIRLMKRLLIRGLEKRKVDPTLVNYAEHSMGLALKALSLILILGIFGVETTSFSAILAAAGVAIGVAWSGLLSNFAAGVFLIILRPFKLGETISAGGVTGVVKEIGLFATSIDSGDNLRFFVGNNKIFSDTILNYSRNTYRIANFRIQLAHTVDPVEAIDQFRTALTPIAGINSEPPVSGEIIEFNPMGPVIAIKASVSQKHYASVMNEGNRMISKVLRTSGYPQPELKALLGPLTGRSES